MLSAGTHPRTQDSGYTLLRGPSVVGNSVELKNVILFDRVQVPHYNYVGDSILGYRSIGVPGGQIHIGLPPEAVGAEVFSHLLTSPGLRGGQLGGAEKRDPVR